MVLGARASSIIIQYLPLAGCSISFALRNPGGLRGRRSGWSRPSCENLTGSGIRTMARSLLERLLTILRVLGFGMFKVGDGVEGLRLRISQQDLQLSQETFLNCPLFRSRLLAVTRQSHSRPQFGLICSTSQRKPILRVWLSCCLYCVLTSRRFSSVGRASHS